jgi:hypothetical protein
VVATSLLHAVIYIKTSVLTKNACGCYTFFNFLYSAFSQPTTTMRILSFGGSDGCTQGGADAAKWLKSTLN